jgi:hypothetical protein
VTIAVQVVAARSVYWGAPNALQERRPAPLPARRRQRLPTVKIAAGADGDRQDQQSRHRSCCHGRQTSHPPRPAVPEGSFPACHLGAIPSAVFHAHALRACHRVACVIVTTSADMLGRAGHLARRWQNLSGNRSSNRRHRLFRCIKVVTGPIVAGR